MTVTDCCARSAAIIAILLLITAAPAKAFGNRESRIVRGPATLEAETGDRVEIEGRVRRVGSDPFPSIVVTDEYGTDWYLSGDAEIVAPYEQQIVKIEGTLELRALTLANGVSAGTRRELKEARVVDSP